MSENLFRRGTTFWCRFYVPLDQQARLGRREFAWSLKTRDPKEARSRLAAARLRFEQLIVPPDPRRIALEDKFGIPADLPAEEALARLQAVIAAGQAADAARWAEDRQQAAQVDPAAFGIDPDNPPADPPDGIAELRIEALHGHRLDDPAFRAAAVAAGLEPDRVIAAEQVAAELVGVPAIQQRPTDLDGLREKWAAERKPSKKTADETASTIAMFVAVAGEKPAGDYVKKDVIAFKDWLLRQPGRMSETLSAASVVKRLNLLKTVLGYGVDNDVIQVNPAAGVTIKGAGNSDRQPFSRADLDVLFRAENLPKSRNYQLIMLAGLYAGARLNEICQLKGADILREDGIWCFGIDDAGDDQSVKNAGSRRLVPIHGVLIDAGIVELATQRGSGQLFDNLEWSDTQGWSKGASKDINRHIRKLIPDTRKVFHSFRHSFKDLCRDAGIAEDVHDRLTGHTSASVGRGYGTGHSIRRLADEIGKIEGRWRLPPT